MMAHLMPATPEPSRSSEAQPVGSAEVDDRYPRQWRRSRPLLAVLAGSLVVLAFPLYGDRYHLDYLMWVAFVPLFLAAQGVGARRGFFVGWIAGMTLEAAGFIWILFAIRSFGGTGPVLSSLIFAAWVSYSTIPWALLGLALGRCRRPEHVLWVIPLWVGIEHLFPRVWPWHIGGAMYARSWLLQCVDVAGVSGLTGLVFLVNFAIYRLYLHRRARGAFPRWTLIATGGAVALALVYGAVRLGQLREFQDGQAQLEVGLVHGSISTRERDESGGERYVDWTKELLSRHPGVDLVVWPESADSNLFVLTSGPAAWGEHRVRTDSQGGTQAPNRRVKIRDDFDVPLLIGAGAVVLVPVDRGGPRPQLEIAERYNVAAYCRADDRVEFYKKNKPVPFGESVPFVDKLPDSWRETLERKFPFIGNLDLGVDNPPMDLDGHTFRNLVCYEAVIPAYVREASVGSDFLVNITEDYWYGRTAHTSQHLSVFILRAVESRVPIVRCTNVGPSGVVDVTGEWHTGGEVYGEGRFTCELRPGQAGSIYREFGHLFALFCLVGGLILQFRLRGVSAMAADGGTPSQREG
jgi:apolipoprotein N-acyltransferase